MAFVIIVLSTRRTWSFRAGHSHMSTAPCCRSRGSAEPTGGYLGAWAQAWW